MLPSEIMQLYMCSAYKTDEKLQPSHRAAGASELRSAPSSQPHVSVEEDPS